MSAEWLFWLRWIAVGWIVVFWRLGYPSLLDPDEAHYAELTREMLHSGSWLVPLLDGKPLIDKPVLFHWLQGLSVLLLGESEFAARLPSALAALALFASLRWIGIALLGEEAGEWGAIMFATIPATFALSSIALFDMLFTAFLFSGVGCLLVAGKQRRRSVEYTGYGLLALAVMTKGPVALVLAGIFLTITWCAGGALRERVDALRWKSGLVAVAVAASPWFIWMDVKFGRVFLEGYALAGNLWYFTQPPVFSRRAISHTYYARAFVGAFFPWSGLVIGRGIDVLRRRAPAPAWSVDEKLLWLWALTVFGFFSIARFKLDHYVFPAAPACCLIAAHAWHEAACGVRGTAATRISVLAIAGLLIVGGSFGSVYLFDLGLELPGIAIALPLALLSGGIALMAASARRDWRVPRTALMPVLALLAAYLVTVGVGYPVLEYTRPTALVGRRLHWLAPADAPVALYSLERWRASLRYYLGRPIVSIDTREDLTAFLARERPAFVVLRRHEYLALRAAGFPLHELIRRPAVVGTTGTGLRRQRWGYIVVASNVPPRGRRVARDP
ncbi:MAG TPA: glycosyltransferase family 39 protein [Vicinamibacterales bacterium]|nr:glycosyltransferase family 39 protein [Vicinamibacterales bacterium]